MKFQGLAASLVVAAIVLGASGCGKTAAPTATGGLTDAEIDNIVRRSYQYVAMYNVINKNAMLYGSMYDTDGWNLCSADTALKDHNFKGIARPNNDTLYTGCMLDLRAEPVIVEYPAFDSTYSPLPSTPTLIENAVVLTGTGERIEPGAFGAAAVLVHLGQLFDQLGPRVLRLLDHLGGDRNRLEGGAQVVLVLEPAGTLLGLPDVDNRHRRFRGDPRSSPVPVTVQHDVANDKHPCLVKGRDMNFHGSGIKTMTKGISYKSGFVIPAHA